MIRSDEGIRQNIAHDWYRVTSAPHASGRSAALCRFGQHSPNKLQRIRLKSKAKAMRVMREQGNATCREILKILGMLGQKSLGDNMAKGSKNTKGCGGKKVSNLFSLVRSKRV